MADYTPEFELFWKKYPSRWNASVHGYVKRKKHPAFDKWQKLSPAIQAECLYKAKYIKAHEGTPRDCVTWLNQYGWEDIELDVPESFVSKNKAAEVLHTVKFEKVNKNNERNRQTKDLLRG